MLEDLDLSEPTTRDHLERVRAFREPREGWSETLSASVVWLGDVAAGTTPGAVTAELITAVLGVLSDVSAWSIDPAGVITVYQDKGYPVSSLEDIRALPIQDVLSVIDGLDVKYKALALLEGVTLGAVPAAAVPSVTAVTTLGFRVINEHAAYFGEDITAQPHARDFARVVMGVAVAPTRETRQRLLDHAAQLGGGADRDAVVRDVAVAQVATIAGAAVARLLGGQAPEDSKGLRGLLSTSHNQAFIRDVCEAARWMYVERALRRQRAV